MIQTAQELITEYVPFTFGFSPNGWNKVYCAVCGDGSRTKGPRGGWKFDNNTAAYNCFNCGIAGVFSPAAEFPFSKNMRKILDAFQVPLQEANKLVYFNSHTKPSTTQQPLPWKIPTIEMPDYLKPVSEAPDIIKKKINKFLQDNYKHSIDSYPFLYSTGLTNSTSPADKAFAKSFLNRVVIPYYKNNNLVYFEGRALDDSTLPKYSSIHSKKGIIYGFDKLYQNINKPLYITEGFFDALHLNGVSVFQNKMSMEQIELLNKCPRQKILVPDFKNDHETLMEQAIENKWDVSIPDVGSCKDVSEAIVKYGKIYVAYSIVKSIKSASEMSFIWRLNKK